MSLKAALCGSYESHLMFYARARAQFVRETSLPLAQWICFVFFFFHFLMLEDLVILQKGRNIENLNDMSLTDRKGEDSNRYRCP